MSASAIADGFVTSLSAASRFGPKSVGLDYGVLMRYEHVNAAREIEEVLGHFFSSTRCRTLGPSRALSFYQFFNCEAPRLERCLGHLGGLEPLEQAT